MYSDYSLLDAVDGYYPFEFSFVLAGFWGVELSLYFPIVKSLRSTGIVRAPLLLPLDLELNIKALETLRPNAHIEIGFYSR